LRNDAFGTPVQFLRTDKSHFRVSKQEIYMPVNFARLRFCETPVSCNALLDPHGRASDIDIKPGRESGLSELSHLNRSGLPHLQEKKIRSFFRHVIRDHYLAG